MIMILCPCRWVKHSQNFRFIHEDDSENLRTLQELQHDYDIITLPLGRISLPSLTMNPVASHYTDGDDLLCQKLMNTQQASEFPCLLEFSILMDGKSFLSC